MLASVRFAPSSILTHPAAGLVHSLRLVHRQAVATRLVGAVVAVGAPTVGACEQNFLPSDCIGGSVPTRRPIRTPTSRTRTPTSAAPDEDQNSLLPRWLPDASQRAGWLARLRADPGRAGAIAAGSGGRLAVLVTIFTADARPAGAGDVGQAAAGGEGVHGEPQIVGKSAAGQPAGPDRPVVVSVVGLVHTPGLVTLTPGARIADALQAAGGAVDGADTIGLNMARPLGDGEQIVVGLAPAAGAAHRAGQLDHLRLAVRRPKAPAPPGPGRAQPAQGGRGRRPQHRDRGTIGRPARRRTRSPPPRSWRGGRPTASSPASTSSPMSTASARRGWTSCAPWSVSDAGAPSRVAGLGIRAPRRPPGPRRAHQLDRHRRRDRVAGRPGAGRRAASRWSVASGGMACCAAARLGASPRLRAHRRRPAGDRRRGRRVWVRDRVARRRGRSPPDHRGVRHGRCR